MTKKICQINYEDALSRVDQRMGEILERVPNSAKEYTLYLKKGKGKLLRSQLLLGCACNDENQVQEDAIKLAAAMEILHLATLIHDDIMDEAKLRRGMLSLNSKYGVKTAVICGDYLLALALREVSDIHRDRDGNLNHSNYIQSICQGELLQHLNLGNINLSLHYYFRIIKGKTATLFEAAAFSGAFLLGATEAQLRIYKLIGRYAGMAFQLQDDCIDFAENTIKVGKNVQNDYEQGVITLPLIYTFKNNQKFKEKAFQKKLSRPEINKAVKESGGINFTQLIAEKYYRKAIKQINKADFSEMKKGKLRHILDKILNK